MAIVLGFQIAVGSTRTDELSVLHGLPLLRLDLAPNVQSVCFVYHVPQRDDDTGMGVLRVGGVEVFVDRNEADAADTEILLNVVAGVDGVSSQTGKVFDNDAVDFPIGHILHHFLKGGAVKDDAAVAIVHLEGHYLYVGVALNEILNELALVGNAVALTGAVICIRQTDVGSCFVLCHEMSLLFVPGKLMKRVISEMA